MPITDDRWEIAQNEEARWWSKDFLIKQNEEIKNKYSEIFNALEQKIGIGNNWNILDVGCGPTCISLLFNKGKKYGIDSLLDEYKDNLSLPDGITLSVRTGEDIGFDNGFFDVVVCRNALDHTKDPGKVMDEINRVLKPGGYFINAVNVCTPLVTKVHRYVENKRWFVREEAHPHFFTVDDIENMISKRFKITEKKFIGRVPTADNSSKFIHNSINMLMNLKFKMMYYKLSKFYLPKQFWRVVFFINKHVFRNGWVEEEYWVVCRK